MDYKPYRPRLEQVGSATDISDALKRARDKKHQQTKKSNSASTDDVFEATLSPLASTHSSSSGALPRSAGLGPRRKSGVVTMAPAVNALSASSLASDIIIKRSPSCMKSSRSASIADPSTVRAPRRVSFADISAPSGNIRLDSGASVPPPVLKSELQQSMESEPLNAAEEVNRNLSQSSADSDVLGENSDYNPHARCGMKRNNSAELRYGSPPVPYTSKPVVTADRRIIAPTFQQQVRGKRRRRSVHVGGASTWQVQDFAMQPTTVDCRSIYYSPKQKTLRSRIASVLSRSASNTSNLPSPAESHSSSPEQSPTPSESGAEDPATVETEGNYILKNLTFRVNPGSLVAVMGPSGSGKTSLLDVIAKRYEGTVHGSVMLNGKRWTMNDVKEHVGYVLQNDNLLPALTVEETLLFMGKLRLPPSVSDKQMRQMVSDIIKELGLLHVADSPVGDGETIRGLSGGERRRVSMGVQLLFAPGILLLDEPTTGLDSFNANQLLRTLTKLTAKQHLVMITIHQPRSDLFRMFNDVILLNSGELIWAGPSRNMLDHFLQIGYPCPADANPLQYFVTLASTSSLNDAEKERTADRVQELKSAFVRSKFNRDMCEEIGWDATPLKRLRLMSISSTTEPEEPFERPSAFSKLLTLTRRAFTNTFRSHGAVFTRTLQLPLLAIYLLIFFTRLGDDQQSVQNRNGLILETLVEISLASAVAAISLCPPMRERYHREASEGMYGAGLFLLSYIIHSVPFSVVSSMLWTVIMYFGAGLQLTVTSFFTYWLVVFLLHLIGECIAILLLGVVSSIAMADSVSTFFIMVGIALGGGVYRVSSTVPKWLEYLSYLTPFTYSGAIMKVNEMRGLQLTGCECDTANATLFGNETATVPLTQPSYDTACGGNATVPSSCLWRTGDEYLAESLKGREWQLNQANNFGILVGLLGVYYILTLIVFACRRKTLH